MKINYLLSDTTKGATTVALKEVIQKAEKNPFEIFVVLVPETKSIIIERELLSLSKSGAFANIYIYSFVRLINRLGFISRDKIVNKQTCVMLIKKIIFDNFDKLYCYKKTAKSVGFAEKIYDTIQQFKSSNISVSDLAEKIEQYSESLKVKLKDILLIYSEYERLLGEELFDDCDKLNLLGTFAKTSEFVKNAEFFVVGFDNITYEMVSVLKELAKASKELTFSSVYFADNRTDKYIQKNDLYNKLKRIADELKYPYIPKFVATSKKQDFYAIQNYLFSTEKKQVESKGQVTVFEAKNKKHEIDFIANQILSEVSAGKRFRDIGLYANDLSGSVKLIKECFDSYEIPYFVNEEHDISSHPLVVFVKDTFEVFRTHLSSDKVLKFLSSFFVDVKNFAVFENYVNAVGLDHTLFLQKPNKDSFENKTEYEQVFEILQNFQDFYEEFIGKISNAKTVSDYLNIVELLFENFDAKNKLQQISKFQLENNLNIDAEISSVIFDRVTEINQTMKNFLGSLLVSVDEFVQIYLSGFSTTKINLSPVSIDSVIIQGNTDGFFDIKTMFVLGAEDGKFPAKIQDSGIILDSELNETMQLISKEIEPTTKEINERELFRVYESLLEPTEKLVISYSLIGADGSQSKPARAVLRLFNLFGESIKQTKYMRDVFASKNGFEMRFAKHLNSYLNDEFLLADLNKEYNILKENMSESYKNWLNKIQFNKPDFIKPDASDLFFVKNKTSISQLEKYFMCPYLFFVTYGLRLKENKNSKISSLDIGSIVHRIAEIFVGEIYKFDGLNEVEFDTEVSKICDDVFEEFSLNLNKNKAVLNFVLDECKRLCKHLFYEQEMSSFKNKNELNEFSFAGENAVKIDVDGRTISIEGKIDRVDEWGGFVRIIDYKTGDVKSDLASVYYGRKIQLVSYLSAVSKIKNCKVAGLVYFPIHSNFVKNDKKIKDLYKMQGFLLDDIDVLKHMDNSVSFESSESHLIPMKIKTSKENVNTNTFELNKARQKIYFDESQFEDLKKYNEKLCAMAMKEILSGYIEPSPICSSGDAEGVCKWCEFADFCGLEKAKFKDGRKCNGLVEIDSFKE